MRTYSDAIQGTVILGFSVIDALGYSTFDTFVNMAHFKYLLFLYVIIIDGESENITSILLI